MMPGIFDQSTQAQVGPGAQYGHQQPMAEGAPWIGGYPQMQGQMRKKRWPWEQEFQQPQGGMAGLQSGPGYMNQSAPWLDGQHMQGIMRRGMPGGGSQGNIR